MGWKAPASRARYAVLKYLKWKGTVTLGEVAAFLGISREAARQHLLQLEQLGWVRRVREPQRLRRVGRPRSRYTLTESGEHLFPKKYDDLLIELLATVDAELGKAALRQVLTALTDARVSTWMDVLQGLDLATRVRLLKDFYLRNDSFMTVETTQGGMTLVEVNCPYLNAAMRQPAICSVTLSALARLLGVRVDRIERFQTGHGRCVFRIHPDQPIPIGFRFAFEPPWDE